MEARLSRPPSFGWKHTKPALPIFAPPHGSSSPRQARPSPPVLPDRIRTGQNQLLSYPDTPSPPSPGSCCSPLHPPPPPPSPPAVIDMARLCVPLLSCNRSGSGSRFHPWMPLDVAMLPPDGDRPVWVGCSCRPDACSPEIIGTLHYWGVFRPAICLRTEITRRYLTGEIPPGACSLVPEDASSPPFLDLVSP
jgi:hypothetical protein